MGCNCSKKKPRPAPRPKPKPDKQSFVLQTSSGRTLTYGSKLEAEAANARSGGSGQVRKLR